MKNLQYLGNWSLYFLLSLNLKKDKKKIEDGFRKEKIAQINM